MVVPVGKYGPDDLNEVLSRGRRVKKANVHALLTFARAVLYLLLRYYGCRHGYHRLQEDEKH